MPEVTRTIQFVIRQYLVPLHGPVDEYDSVVKLIEDKTQSAL